MSKLARNSDFISFVVFFIYLIEVCLALRGSCNLFNVLALPNIGFRDSSSLLYFNNYNLILRNNYFLLNFDFIFKSINMMAVRVKLISGELRI